MSSDDHKPNGWRWKLPWSHAEDSKLPLIMMVVSLGFAAYFFVNMGSAPSAWVVGAIAAFTGVAGILFAVAFRD